MHEPLGSGEKGREGTTSSTRLADGLERVAGAAAGRLWERLRQRSGGGGSGSGALGGTRQVRLRQGTGTSADATLRELGIIRQRGVVRSRLQQLSCRRGTEVAFDPALRAWVTLSANGGFVPVAQDGGGGCSGSVPPDALQQRVDEVPAGVIWVVGDLPRSRLEVPSARGHPEPGKAHGASAGGKAAAAAACDAVDRQFRELEAMLSFVRQAADSSADHRADVDGGGADDDPDVGAPVPLAAINDLLTRVGRTHRAVSRSGGGTSSDSVIANLGAAETDPRFLSDVEVRHTVQQYLLRSLPEAAMRSGALLVTSCDDATAEALGEGLQIVGEAADVAALRVAPADVFARESALAQRGFTHLLALDSNGDCGGGRVDAGYRAAKPPLRRREVTLTLERVVTHLAAGCAAEAPIADGNRAAPPRPRVPVVMVIVGGDEGEVLVLAHCALKNEWPLFIVQGSGGFADVLAEHVQRAMHHAEMSDDARRHYCAQLDAPTAQIVASARCIVVPRGEVVDTLTQSVAYALRGDGTLQRAWVKHESWRCAAEHHARWHRALMLLVLLLGLVATGVSVFLTLFQIMYPVETLPSHARDPDASFSSSVATTYDVLNLVVIFLPIAMQLVQTVANRQANGTKWAALWFASESAKREIFLMRAEMGDYSRASVLNARRAKAEQARKGRQSGAHAAPGGGMTSRGSAGGGNNTDSGAQRKRKDDSGGSRGAADDGGGTAGGEGGAGAGEADDAAQRRAPQGYATRQELLHLRLEELTLELSELISDASVGEYAGPIPRRESLHPRDDGTSDLGPDDYAEFRLGVAVADYSQRARAASLQRLSLDISIHVLNTVGTILGAIATNEIAADYNVQAWVAFTTATVSALSRYDHWLMVEWSKSKYTQTALTLGAVVSWWASRGNLAGQPQVRSELSRRVENIITGEVAEFRKQLMTSADAASRAAEDMAGIKRQAETQASEAVGLSREAQEARRRFKELNLGGVSVGAIRDALRDPRGAAAKALSRTLRDLNSELGDVIGKAKEAARVAEEAIETASSTAVTFEGVKALVTDASGCLAIPARFGEFNFTKFIPSPVAAVVASAQRRGQLLGIAGASFNLSISGSIRLADFADMTASIDSKVHTEFAQLPARLQLETIRRACREEALECLAESLPASRINVYNIVPVREQLGDAVEHLEVLGRAPWRHLDHAVLIKLVASDALRTRLAAMSEPKLRALLKRVEHFCGQSAPLCALLRTATDDAATLDLHNNLFAAPGDRLVIIERVAQLRPFSFDIELLSRPLLTRFFPTAHHAALADLDKACLAAMVRIVDKGLPMAALLESAIHVHENTAGLRQRLITTFRPPARIDIFASAADDLSQRDVQMLTKEELLKRLMARPGVDRAFINELRDVSEGDLKLLISRYLASASRSYVGGLFDKLSEQMSSMDAHELLSHEQQVLLVSRTKEFRGADLSQLKRKHILKLIGLTAIAAQLRDMYGYQLRELVQRLLHGMSQVFTTRFLNEALDHEQLAPFRDYFDSLSQLHVDRLVSSLATISPNELRAVTADALLPAGEVRRRALLLIPDVEARDVLRRSGMHVGELRLLVTRMLHVAPDRASIRLLNMIANDLLDDVAVSVIDLALATVEARELFLRLLAQLFRDPEFSWYRMTRIPSGALISYFEHVNGLQGRRGPATANPPERSAAAASSSTTSGSASDEDTSRQLRPSTAPAGEVQMSPAMQLHRKLCNSLNTEAHAIFLLHSMTHATVSAPIAVFGAIAERVRSFSLANLVREVGARTLLLHMVLDMLDGSWWGTDGNPAAAQRNRQPQVPQQQQPQLGWHGGGNGTPKEAVLIVGEQPAMPRVRRFMDALPSLFQPLVRCLFLLREEQMRELLCHCASYCATSPLVALFRAVRAGESRGALGDAGGGCCGKDGADATGTSSRLRALQVRLVAAMLEAHIVGNPFVVRCAFAYFDATAFVAKPTAERLRALLDYVAWEGLAETAAHWPEATFRHLFDLLSTKPIFAVRPSAGSQQPALPPPTATTEAAAAAAAGGTGGQPPELALSQPDDSGDGAVLAAPAISDADSHLRYITERSRQMAAVGVLAKIRELVDQRQRQRQRRHSEPGGHRSGGADPARVRALVQAAAKKFLAMLTQRHVPLPASADPPPGDRALPPPEVGEDDANDEQYDPNFIVSGAEEGASADGNT